MIVGSKGNHSRGVANNLEAGGLLLHANRYTERKLHQWK